MDEKKKKNYTCLLDGEQFVMITAPTQVMQCFLEWTSHNELRSLGHNLLAFQNSFFTQITVFWQTKALFFSLPQLPRTRTETISSGSGQRIHCYEVPKC